MANTKQTRPENTRILRQQLYNEQNRYNLTNAILEGGNLIIWAVDTSLKLVSFNQNYFNTLLPHTDRDTVGLEVKGRMVTKNAGNFWRSKYKKVLTGTSLNIELRVAADSGEFEWKEVFLNPIYNNEGSIVAVSGMAYDITDKMNSRKELMLREEMFRNIYESFQDLYFRCDFSGRITMLSPSVKDIAGYSEKRLLNKNITNYYIYNARTKSLLRGLVANHSVRNFEAEIIHKSGKVIPCICNVRLILKNDRPYMIEGVARDITELKHATEQLKHSKEVAEKSLAVKERFLANMSHEIRTPLNGIIGMLHVLNQTNLNPIQKEHVKTLQSSSEVLMSLLNDLLDMSKIEAGKMEANICAFDLRHFMDKLKLLYTPQASENGISLNLVMSHRVPHYIHSDENKLLQIYSNLISNAIKFTPEGGNVYVSMDTEQGDDGKLFLRGKVKDTGIGISKENQEQLFKSFTQLDSSLSKSYKGTGLGLYITRQLVRLLDGDITVDSTPGQGSQFIFSIPVTPADKPVRDPESSASVSKILEECSVLIVDDNSVNLQLAASILQKALCHTTTAQSGQEAIVKCHEEKFDLILMDIQMPDMDGLETTAAIRTTGINQETAILAMTAYSMEGDEDKFIYSGMDDYIAKPIKPDLLLGKVKKWAMGQAARPAITEPYRGEQELVTINANTLAKLKEFGGEEMVREALSEFDTECEAQLQACAEHWQTKNYKEILNILHTLKGNAGTLGVEKMAAMAQFIEAELKKKKYHIFEDKLAELRALYKDFQSALTELKI